MIIFIQLVSIIALFLLTYIGLLAFGPPREGLLYTKQEKADWDQMISNSILGDWLTSTNIIGTLTSFATVFLFFLGNAPIFGWVMLICTITIWFGSFFTNRLTTRICADPHVMKLLDSPDQVGGVIASIFWRSDSPSRLASKLVKWLSLANIAAVIWLEFSLLAHTGGELLHLPNILTRGLLLWIAVLAVFYFVLRFGLRGFVFADLFQAPIIVISTLILLLGGFLALGRLTTPPDLASAFAPGAPSRILILFVLHVFFLNSFLVIVTEPHWLRVWVFRSKETSRQAMSTFWTAAIWGLLILGGITARLIAPAPPGVPTVVGFANALSSLSPLFLVAFWFAGTAALFSTADANLYSFLVVHGFDPSTGTLHQQRLASLRPARVAIIASLLFLLAYLFVQYLELPFEKLIFLIMPLGMNTLPGLVQLANGRPANPVWILLSLAGYVLCAVLGLFAPANELAWTLGAAFIPVVISGFLYLGGRKSG